MIKKRKLTLFSWNVNGIRACIRKGFLNYLMEYKPDLFFLQEIKADESQLTQEIVNPEGYISDWFPAVKKGYSGTGILIKKGIKISGIRHGMDFPLADTEGRTQTVIIDKVAVLNCYFPNSRHDYSRLDFKLEFNNSIVKYLNRLRKKGFHTIITGDFNVAHKEIDLKNPKQNVTNPGFLPQEREWMTSFLSRGYIDTFRHFYPDLEDQYTWWSYRKGVREKNIGWRIDYFCVNRDLADVLIKASIHPQIMGSDHCPVSLQFWNTPISTI